MNLSHIALGININGTLAIKTLQQLAILEKILQPK
jgi:hypothetical protein